MFRSIAIIAVASACCAAPLSAEEPAPQGEYVGLSASEIGNRIAAGCADHGWSITERTQYQVVCADRVLAIPPSPVKTQDFARFNLIELDGKVRVVGEGYRMVIDRLGNTTPATSFAARGSLEGDMRQLLDSIASKAG